MSGLMFGASSSFMPCRSLGDTCDFPALCSKAPHLVSAPRGDASVREAMLAALRRVAPVTEFSDLGKVEEAAHGVDTTEPSNRSTEAPAKPDKDLSQVPKHCSPTAGSLKRGRSKVTTFAAIVPAQSGEASCLEAYGHQALHFHKLLLSSSKSLFAKNIKRKVLLFLLQPRTAPPAGCEESPPSSAGWDQPLLCVRGGRFLRCAVAMRYAEASGCIRLRKCRVLMNKS